MGQWGQRTLRTRHVLKVSCPQCLVLNVSVLNVLCLHCPIGIHKGHHKEFDQQMKVKVWLLLAVNRAGAISGGAKKEAIVCNCQRWGSEYFKYWNIANINRRDKGFKYWKQQTLLSMKWQIFNVTCQIQLLLSGDEIIQIQIWIWIQIQIQYNSFTLQVARRSVSSKILLKSNQGEREVEALVKVGFSKNIDIW